MARLHEYQGKQLLKEAGIAVPAGGPAASPEQARKLAADIGRPVVVKIQAWTTSRAKMGGIKFADTPEQAAEIAGQLLGMQVGSFTVDRVLVEEKLAIETECYASIIIDDAACKPLLLFSLAGGSGIEERAAAGGVSVAQTHLDVTVGLPDYEARNLVRRMGISGKTQLRIADVLVKLAAMAIKKDARSAEINPLVVTADGRVMAADCRFTIDDYAVFRHKELGIEIAREMDHPPTELERISYEVEKNDHRGTFYFAQLAQGFGSGEGYLGFHGAGGGGSMMSMDAITKAGFKIANFTDTSGNPSAAKVYRAAMIILSQPNLDGYFGSGSGVASQEQYHSAYGLAKAFYEMNLSIPAVIRLGGNSEDRAVRILTDYCKNLPARVEGYRKDDTPAFCAERIETLVAENAGKGQLPMTRRRFTSPKNGFSFPISGGAVYVDYDKCDDATNALLLEYGKGIFKIENGKPALAISEEEVAGKDSELIACEVECRGRAQDAIYVSLPIAGLHE
ncbi:MAG: acetate--CoA ligase family protein [Phycisphaerae bacterium]|nr:acetate--CoA ligase family protein [Phycisphaerae bacterium]